MRGGIDTLCGFLRHFVQHRTETRKCVLRRERGVGLISGLSVSGDLQPVPHIGGAVAIWPSDAPLGLLAAKCAYSMRLSPPPLVSSVEHDYSTGSLAGCAWHAAGAGPLPPTQVLDRHYRAAQGSYPPVRGCYEPVTRAVESRCNGEKRARSRPKLLCFRPHPRDNRPSKASS